MTNISSISASEESAKSAKSQKVIGATYISDVVFNGKTKRRSFWFLSEQGLPTDDQKPLHSKFHAFYVFPLKE